MANTALRSTYAYEFAGAPSELDSAGAAGAAGEGGAVSAVGEGGAVSEGGGAGASPVARGGDAGTDPELAGEAGVATRPAQGRGDAASKSCGCRTAGAPSGSTLGLAALLGAALALRLHRVKRR